MLWKRWVLCNMCITSVHDTAKGFWGIGLRKSQAEVAERIRDTLHRPDDTYSTGQRGYCVRRHLYLLLKKQCVSGRSILMWAMQSRKWQQKITWYDVQSSILKFENNCLETISPHLIAVLEKSITSHGFHQQIEFAWFPWTCRCSSFHFFMSI